MEDLSLTILVTTDVHGFLLPFDYTKDAEDIHGSLAQISTLIQDIRKKEDHVLVFDAGDLVQGNASALFAKDPIHPAVACLNAIGYDGWVLGNHEFDYGSDFIYRSVQGFQGDVLLGNIQSKQDPSFFKPYQIYEIGDFKMGVVGLTTPLVGEFKEKTSLKRDFSIEDPKLALERILQDLPPVDSLVGIFHMGIRNENNHENTGVRDVISDAKGAFDAIAAAHMHQLEPGILVDKTLVAEAGMFASHLLRLDLAFEKSQGRYQLVGRRSSLIPVYLDQEVIAPDPKIIHLLKPYHQKARKKSEEILGKVLEPMDKSREGEHLYPIGSYPSPLTSWMGTVLLEASQADLVAFHLDNPYPHLEIGPFRKKDIYRNYHYAGGEMSVYEIKGWQLKKYMEWSASYFNRIEPGDVTVSIDEKRARRKYSTFDFFYGISYTMDLHMPKGNLIVQLSYRDGRKIQDEDTLKIGVNSYRMKALTSPGGLLEKVDVPFLYSTIDEDRFGPKKGRIQDLLKEDIRRRKCLTKDFPPSFTVLGPDLSSPEAKATLDLIKKGILVLDYNPTTSINIYEPMDPEEEKALYSRLGLNLPLLEDAQKGQVYLAIFKALSQ